MTLRLLPSAFSDPATEAAFLGDFRTAGLRSTQYACGVAVAGYLLIWAVDIYFNGWSSVAALRRIIVISLLGLIVLVLRRKSPNLINHYNLFLGSLVFVAYVSSVSVTHLFREDDPTTVVTPAALIGLWLIYGFVRLPLNLAILLGVAGAACALLGSRVTNLHDPTAGTFIYLVIANALGITQARSAELRERQLFLKRRTLEVAEAELRNRSRRAEQASSEKTRLIAAVGHDLRQPMMAAVLHLSVLESRLEIEDSEGTKDQATKIRESIKLLGDTLEHLLLAARYDTGTEPIMFKEVALCELLIKLRSLCEPLLSAGGPQLLIRVPRADLAVITDEHALLRSLVNLVSNALKFSKAAGSTRSRVVVRARVVGEVCRIIVADNGVGISDDAMDDIWEPFFQVDNLERNREKGLGLGLYLVRKAFLRLDGHFIGVASTPGKGTQFVMTMRAVKLSEPAPLSDEAKFHPADASAARPTNLCGMYVLVVEDDREARVALEAQLHEWGVLFLSAQTVEELLTRQNKCERIVDAIIADYRLPGRMDGIAFIRAVRDGLGYEPDALLITAEVDSQLIAQQLPDRIVLLQKPFEPASLRRMLATALGRALAGERNIES